MTGEVRYAIGDLARLAGVSRRTVRYYVQEGLIPQPLGVGRGNHYGQHHLDQILRVKAMQDAGRTLDEIRRGTVKNATATAALPRPPDRLFNRSLWRRLRLAPGVELHVAGDIRLPSPGRLEELAAWCQLHMRSDVEESREEDD
jgi:DNA-binding transcriptional MerR regulator